MIKRTPDEILEIQGVPKRTPEEIVDKSLKKLCATRHMLSLIPEIRTQMLSELESYYTSLSTLLNGKGEYLKTDKKDWDFKKGDFDTFLKISYSDEELRELLPKKKDTNFKPHNEETTINKLKNIIHNDVIDLTFKALQGGVPRGLSREHFRSIMSEHTPTIAEDSQQPEWTQGELDKAYDDLMGEGIGSAMLKQVPIGLSVPNMVRIMKSVKHKVSGGFTMLPIEILNDLAQAIYDAQKGKG